MKSNRLQLSFFVTSFVFNTVVLATKALQNATNIPEILCYLLMIAISVHLMNSILEMLGVK